MTNLGRTVLVAFEEGRRPNFPTAGDLKAAGLEFRDSADEPTTVVLVSAEVRSRELGQVASGEFGALLRRSLGWITQQLDATLPRLTDAGCGSIVIVSSNDGLLGPPGRSEAAALGGAVIGLLKSVAVEVAQAGVALNGVCVPREFSARRLARLIGFLAVRDRYIAGQILRPGGRYG